MRHIGKIKITVKETAYCFSYVLPIVVKEDKTACTNQEKCHKIINFEVPNEISMDSYRGRPALSSRCCFVKFRNDTFL